MPHAKSSANCDDVFLAALCVLFYCGVFFILTHGIVDAPDAATSSLTTWLRNASSQNGADCVFNQWCLLPEIPLATCFWRDQEGRVFKLDVAIGRMTRIAESGEQFRELSRDQYIGFKIPLVFAESGSPGDAFVANLHEQVSFLGTLHRQISELPDGTKVRVKVDQ